jgi:nucleoside-diphosphate-sugar epimerase
MSGVAITGASGYVGSAIARCFRAHGWDVLELGRRTKARYDLEGEVVVDWRGIDALVHCAWEFGVRRWEDVERVNVRGSARLMEAAREAGVTAGVFISSLSSFEGCRSLYGKGKLAVEREAARMGFAVVRPGLVHGERPGGMMGALEKAVQASAVVPLIGDGSYPQYLVHEEDLGELVFALCQPGQVAGEPVPAASREAIAFRELLRRIAARHGRKPMFVPVPWRLILAALKTMESVGLNPPFRSDSLLGFVFQNPEPHFEAARQITSFRAFQ